MKIDTEKDCGRCNDTGVVPCDNCQESDEHDCWIDGEVYGPYPCSCEAGKAIDQW